MIDPSVAAPRVTMKLVQAEAASQMMQADRARARFRRVFFIKCVVRLGILLTKDVYKRQIQGGAGTTTNMNANEVIANRAREIMGHAHGEYQYCSPNDHVNCSQSTNDAYPIACLLYTSRCV